MADFQFLHTGDIHLDSSLKNLAGQDGPAAELIRTATRRAFSNLVDLAIADEVAFVVIAGDLYDGDWRDFQTGLLFVRQMGRLANAQIPVYLIWGNHDAESQITKRLNLPDNVKVFSSRKPQTLKLDGLPVAIHGQSFKQRDVTENLVPAYPAPIADCFNIGVLHTGLGGMSGHANYAPCSMDDLVNKGITGRSRMFTGARCFTNARTSSSAAICKVAMSANQARKAPASSLSGTASSTMSPPSGVPWCNGPG